MTKKYFLSQNVPIINSRPILNDLLFNHNRSPKHYFIYFLKSESITRIQIKQKLYPPPRCVDPWCEPANCHGQIKKYSTWQKVHITKFVLIHSFVQALVFGLTTNKWNTESIECWGGYLLSQIKNLWSDATQESGASKHRGVRCAADRLMLFSSSLPRSEVLQIADDLLSGLNCLHKGWAQSCLRNEVKKLDVWKYLFRLAWHQPQVWLISKAAKV